MSNYTKKDVIKLVYDEGMTLWDLLELFKTSYEKNLYDIIEEIFGSDLIGYANLHFTIELNNKKYKTSHIPPSTITKEELIQMVNSGNTQIDFMRLLCIDTTNKFHKFIKEALNNNTKEYNKFIRMIKMNNKLHFEKLNS